MDLASSSVDFILSTNLEMLFSLDFCWYGLKLMHGSYLILKRKGSYYVKEYTWLLLLWQPLVTMTNSNTSNKSLSKISSRDHKKTWQGVSAGLLPYLYKLHMVHATNNYSCPNIHALSMSTPCVYHKIAM